MNQSGGTQPIIICSKHGQSTGYNLTCPFCAMEEAIRESQLTTTIQYPMTIIYPNQVIIAPPQKEKEG